MRMNIKIEKKGLILRYYNIYSVLYWQREVEQRIFHIDKMQDAKSNNERTPVVPLEVSEPMAGFGNRKTDDVRRTATIVLIILGIELV